MPERRLAADHCLRLTLVSALCLATAACGDDGGGPDGSLPDTGVTDARPDSTRPDAGMDAGEDAGGDAGDDAGPADGSAGDGGTDGGSMDGGPMDGGPMDGGPMDGGPMDGGPVDGGPADGGGMDASTPDTTAQIEAVRAATTGAIVPALPVEGATVTYVRDALGEDPAGFFVQAEQTGPALFVTVDPSTLSPVPAAGDVVSFEVTTTERVSLQHRVTGITGYGRDATGADTSALVQEISSAGDLVSNVGSYESELVTISGTLSGSASGAGPAYTRIRLVTSAIDDGRLVLRTPTDVYIDNTLQDGCEVTVGPSPLWRFNDAAQAQAYVAADLTVSSCPSMAGTAPAPNDLVITEIFYDEGTADADGPYEWVELFNPGDSALQLYGCELDDDPTGGGQPRYVLAPVQVDPGSYVVFGGSSSEAAPVAPFGPALNNTGDVVQVSCGGSVVDAVDYGASDFPSASGASLKLDPRETTAALNDAGAAWCASTTSYGTMGFSGTPGADNPTCSTTGELMFTEYVEGTANNKALEIANVGGADIDVTPCRVETYNNGASTPSATYMFPVATILSPGQTYVLCDASIDSSAIDLCDDTSGVAQFNGDDAIVLRCITDVRDVIGQVGVDPGSSWSGDGVSTAGSTLRRACTADPDTDETDPYNPSAAGWVSYPVDTFSDLGNYAACP